MKLAAGKESLDACAAVGAANLAAPAVLSAPDLDALAGAAADAAQSGVADIVLEAPGRDLAVLHQSLSLIWRGALDRIHPGLAYPTFVRVGPGEFEMAVLGITKFAAIMTISDSGGDTWLPLWTLRQNIYTAPQKPLQIAPNICPIGEPDTRARLVVTTNFSLTYFIVSTELDGAGMPSHLVVVDTEGMSALTAWSAGKFSGERVAKALRDLGACERVRHKTVIIPGCAAVISGELEDALGDGWRVLTGPQEASDLAPFALAEACWHAGWVDRGGRITDRLPARHRVLGSWGTGTALSPDGSIALWERDLASLIRAKGAIFARIRALHACPGNGAAGGERVVVSGNFGRFLKLPAAVSVGLLPDLPLGRFGHVHNGSLEGAALALLSREFVAEITVYVARITYVDLSELPMYADKFVGACFLPHTSPDALRL